MRVLKAIGSFFASVGRLLGRPETRQAAEYAIEVANSLRILIPIPQVELVVAAYRSFGIPLSEALSDGKLTEEEVKMLVGRLAGLLIQRRFPTMSTTQTLILANSGYEESKP